MDKNRAHYLTVTTATLLGMTLLMAAGEERLGVYLSVFAISYFASLEIFNPRRKWVDVIAIFLFIAFVILVAFKAATVLGYR